MKLNKGDRVRDGCSVYVVVAVVMSTAYLRATNCGYGCVCCDIQDVCSDYKIEILD